MNKELIKKYKKEFDHWLDGGKILVYFVTDTVPEWVKPDPEEALDPWGYTDVKIIIDDEYVEFRKALAEGKTLQIRNGQGIWKDVKGMPYVVDISNNLRIKPEEPQFKVGQHIQAKGGAYIGPITLIDKHVMPICAGYTRWKPEDIEVCKPPQFKVGEQITIECVDPDKQLYKVSKI